MAEDDDPTGLPDKTLDFARALAPTIEMMPEPDASLEDDRVHIQTSATLTACNRNVDRVRLAEVGDTVNCPDCMAWLDEDDEKTPARGITASGSPIPVEVELTLEKDPVVQISFDVSLPDGKRVRVEVPQTVVDVLHHAWSTDSGPHRMSWRWPGQAVPLNPEGGTDG